MKAAFYLKLDAFLTKLAVRRQAKYMTTDETYVIVVMRI
jgi:hypothetical protein